MEILSEQDRHSPSCCIKTSVALQMIDIDLNDDAEKKVVEGAFWNAVDMMIVSDRP